MDVLPEWLHHHLLIGAQMIFAYFHIGTFAPNSINLGIEMNNLKIRVTDDDSFNIFTPSPPRFRSGVTHDRCKGRKFVFAPRCRGVSAKRSAKLNNEELRELNDLEETWMDWPKSTADELPDSSFETRRKSILQKLFEKFNDYSLREEDN
ncbi:hypothetical protein NPIL_548301 [Nephila pilipes]|uniref:Uncharacterized protein n=1 Tax=Nephila pilipes TaxID=299642 RepID=A0A8X6U622_NEPPI|nr:hypothetical protein NPIL_548301 [Nephila pilipes]